MLKLFISTLILTLASYTAKDTSIVGRWEAISSRGILAVMFKADKTYEGYNNSQLFTKGTYSFKDSIYTIETDEMTGCADTKGIYKITFFADTAMRGEVINDDCTGRKEGTDGVMFKRKSSGIILRSE